MSAQNYDTTIPYVPVYIPYGYFGGGTPYTSRVDRIDYANDTATAAVKGSLSSARYGLAATGNSSFGYFGGGGFPTSMSIVDRIDYSNDTATAAIRGPLSLARDGLAATGNSSYGYFGGGGLYPPPTASSLVDRIDYSNDMTIATVKGPLSAARYILAATGNSSYGYFGGGSSYPLSTEYSLVDRIDYSNDTNTAIAKGPLSSAVSWFAAISNSSYGYFGGGYLPSATSIIDRIDYTNDTATAVVKGPLSTGLYALAASGNSSYGYFGGGLPNPTTLYRMEYSNDTNTAIARGLLTRWVNERAATNHNPV